MYASFLNCCCEAEDDDNNKVFICKTFIIREMVVLYADTL